MTLVKVLRGGQMTLPAEARKALRLREGDYLEAEIVGGKLELRPVAVVDRGQAWSRLIGSVDRDRWIGPEPRPGPEDEEQWILDVLAGDGDDRGA
jgi:AbrB family looped-hinge helix DNA binding protein